MQEQIVNIPGGLDWRKNWEDYINSLRRCCEIAENAGVKYSLEPHPYRYVSNADGMLRILEHVNSDVLGMNFDPSHLFPSGEIPQVVIYKLGKRIIHCHLSDNDAVTNVHWRPGKGKMDWESILCALRDVGYQGVLSLELEDVPGVSRSGRLGGIPEEATEELDIEYRKGMEYLGRICKKVGIELE